MVLSIRNRLVWDLCGMDTRLFLSIAYDSRMVTANQFTQDKKAVIALEKNIDDCSTVLELILADGEVGDDGLHKIVGALNRVVETDLGRHTYHVKELNLTGNQLTIASALPLSRVVSRNTAHLQDINLARNNIAPVSQEHLDDWESFLESFRNCRRINKLDLSENNFSNPKALEVFLRVYRSHKPIDRSLLYDADVAP